MANKAGFKVFVSYSHRDKEWLERLQIHLRPLQRDGVLEVWDDTQLKGGAVWRQELEAALSSATATVLLISASFLASDFIVNEEVAALLLAAREKGTRILPLIVSWSAFARTPSLSQFQAINDPERPLSDLSYGEQERVLDKVAQTLHAALQDSKVEDFARAISDRGDSITKQQELVNLLVVFSMGFFLFRMLEDFDRCEKGELKEYIFRKEPGFEANIRWLRDHGYLEMTFRVGGLHDHQNIAPLVKLTPAGRIYVQLRRTHEAGKERK
jgi:hypothetical protein